MTQNLPSFKKKGSYFGLLLKVLLCLSFYKFDLFWNKGFFIVQTFYLCKIHVVLQAEYFANFSKYTTISLLLDS